MIGISACLAGETCRYDGKTAVHPEVLEYMREHPDGYVLLCPEVLGGLPTPRVPCEIQGGTGKEVLMGSAKVMSRTGKDQTKAYVQGAYRALELLQKEGAKEVWLKEKSPSCGSCQIYDGTFGGRKIDGQGVTCALLREKGIFVKGL